MLTPLLFDADTLACALTLTGKAAPTPAALSAALRQLYPSGPVPTVADVLTAGWLVPTIDGAGLRLPPMPVEEQNARLVLAALLDTTGHPNAGAESREIAGIKPAFSEPLKKANNRNETGIESAFSEPGEEPNNRRITDGEPAAPAATIGIETEWPAPPRFSYYRGGILATAPYAAITPAQLHTVLTSPRHRARTEALRAAPVGSPERANLKKGLDYVTPAGTFTRRANDALAEPSGLLVLDFDHLENVAAARAALLADAELAPELVLLFTSPSGDGLKVLVRTDPTATHLDNFRAWADYLSGHYWALGLTPDEAGKDVARACFVPYAPDAWLAPAYARTA